MILQSGPKIEDRRVEEKLRAKLGINRMMYGKDDEHTIRPHMETPCVANEKVPEKNHLLFGDLESAQHLKKAFWLIKEAAVRLRGSLDIQLVQTTKSHTVSRAFKDFLTKLEKLKKQSDSRLDYGSTVTVTHWHHRGMVDRYTNTAASQLIQSYLKFAQSSKLKVPVVEVTDPSKKQPLPKGKNLDEDDDDASASTTSHPLVDISDSSSTTYELTQKFHHFTDYYLPSFWDQKSQDRRHRVIQIFISDFGGKECNDADRQLVKMVLNSIVPSNKGRLLPIVLATGGIKVLRDYLHKSSVFPKIKDISSDTDPDENLLFGELDNAQHLNHVRWLIDQAAGRLGGSLDIQLVQTAPIHSLSSGLKAFLKQLEKLTTQMDDTTKADSGPKFTVTHWVHGVRYTRAEFDRKGDKVRYVSFPETVEEIAKVATPDRVFFTPAGVKKATRDELIHSYLKFAQYSKLEAPQLSVPDRWKAQQQLHRLLSSGKTDEDVFVVLPASNTVFGESDESDNVKATKKFESNLEHWFDSRDWQPNTASQNCKGCKKHIISSFFSTNKHHCRKCGFIFCRDCASRRVWRDDGEKRVCTSCENKLDKNEDIVAGLLSEEGLVVSSPVGEKLASK